MAMRLMSVVDVAIMKIRPEILESNMTYYAITDRTAPSQIVFYITSYLTPWVVILIAVICRWKIDRYLDQIVFSTSVRELQKSIGNIFHAQTIGPILLALISIFYVIYTFIGMTDGSRAVFENIMAKPIGVMYIVNPITTIYFITPYRKAFLKYIRKNLKKAVTEVTRFYLRIENFIKTQSNKDQTAYGIHGEKKNEECRL
uniref:G_PROTEIN_RECEP_F1_2 domain-containing protein n=2 Tax=Caenorhabditis tropicalis TaxID=1561998 RepID=A0A1I7T6P2_9PELO